MFLGVLGIGVVGYLVYRYMNSAQKGQYVIDPNSPKTSYLNPELKYPFTPTQTVVAQTSNQAYSGSDRATTTFNNGSAVNKIKNSTQYLGNLGDLQGIVQDLGSVKSIADDLSNLWDTLGVSSWFSEGDPTATFQDVNFGDMTFENWV